MISVCDCFLPPFLPSLMTLQHHTIHKHIPSTAQQTRPVIAYFEAQTRQQQQQHSNNNKLVVARIPGQLDREEVFGRIKVLLFLAHTHTHSATQNPFSSFNKQAAVDPLIGREVLGLTERLLRAIAEGDWATYEELCAQDMTCFEPEARGHLVEGLVRALVEGPGVDG